MKKFLSLPTWLLNRVACGPEHPFYGMTLEDWHRGETDVARMFDALFWITGAAWWTVVVGIVVMFS